MFMLKFSSKIISWYWKNSRFLPWKETKDPYKIWVSEIILQQTRVEQGRSYYLRFIENFPSVSVLAKANEEEVLHLWQGLGYYSRARNMHTAAKQIITDFNGVFPRNYHDILSLKGVGEYTAKAIASYSYNDAYAVVDANVKRIIARIYGIVEAVDNLSTKKQITLILEGLLDKTQAAVFNQAMMDFGSLVCLAKNPKCAICIFSADCKAYKQNTTDLIPVRRAKIKQKKRYFHYIICVDKNKNTLIHKRMKKDIWQHLYEFPLFEDKQILSKKDIVKKINMPARSLALSETKKHILSHQIINANFYILQCENCEKFSENLDYNGFRLVKIAEIRQFPFPKLIEQYITNILFN
jgi:A/G-specific adenine glycosylase